MPHEPYIEGLEISGAWSDEMRGRLAQIAQAMSRGRVTFSEFMWSLRPLVGWNRALERVTDGR